MKVRFYKLTLVKNGIITSIYTPAKGKNHIINEVASLKLPTITIDFIGWHLVNIYIDDNDGVYFSTKFENEVYFYKKNELGFTYLYNCLDKQV